jgi:hypothetical protein
MDNAGVLIFFALVGALICAKARSAGGAVLFGALALALFVSTPAGSGLPGAVADFLGAVSEATAALSEDGDEGSGAVG